MSEDLQDIIEEVIEEDAVESRGIHPLNRGYMWRGGRDYLFPPSFFAEARFMFMSKIEKRKFTDLVQRVKENDAMARRYPEMARWIEQVEKNPRRYAEKEEDKKRTDLDGLAHDIQHSDVTLVKTDGEQVYIEKNGIVIPKHKHRSSKNLVNADPLKVKRFIIGGDHKIPYYGCFSVNGNLLLRVKSKENGNHPEAMSYWDVRLSNPFVDYNHIRGEFNADEGTQFHRHHLSAGWWWCNLDWDILKELRRYGLPTTRERETVIVDFHKAVALTAVDLEHKDPGKGGIKFLEYDLQSTPIMPYNFVEGKNDDLVFRAIVARYGLGMHYEEVDQMLLDEDISSDLFKTLHKDLKVTLEIVKSTKGMNNPEARHMIQNIHFNLLNKKYECKGAATVLKGSKHEMFGFTHVRDDNTIYILYGPEIKYPLLLENPFDRVAARAADLFGCGRRLDENIPLLLQGSLDAFQSTDYRTGRNIAEARIVVPEDMVNDEYKGFYKEWRDELLQ